MIRDAAAFGLVLFFVACSGQGTGDDATTPGTSAPTTEQTTPGTSMSGTSESTGVLTGATSKTTGEGTADVTGITGEETMTMGSTSGSSTGTGSTGTGSTGTGSTTGSTSGGDACVEPPFDPDPKGESGAVCLTDEECAPEQRCFLVPLLGGLCGECLVDADCPDGGCTVPNLLNSVGAVCNTGKPGAGCESDAVCDSTCNNHCGLAIDASPILKINTCGACKTSDDCVDGEGDGLCVPKVDIVNFTGTNACVSPGSLADGESCSLQPGDEAACASGICATAAVMNVFKVGVCSECDVDEDCGPGESCNNAYVDDEGGVLVAGACQ